MVDASTVRIVPPPDPSTMQQRKRRSNKPKTAESPVEGSIVLPDATLADVVEQTPEQANEASVASERVAPLVAPTFGDPILKSGPVVEILQKRLKALNKKIVLEYLCYSWYQVADTSCPVTHNKICINRLQETER